MILGFTQGARAHGQSLGAGSILGAATIFLIGSFASEVAFAGTLKVCPTCALTTIQGAVDAAVSGDTVLISAGHYLEHIRIAGKALTLQGVDRDSVIIDAEDKATVVTIGDLRTAVESPVTLRDLTLTRGFAPFVDGGITGGGITVNPGASLNLRHSVVVGNKSQNAGGGIGGFSTGTVDIVDCIIAQNTAVDGGGIALGGDHGTLNIADTDISRNTATDFGGGLNLLYRSSTISLSRTTVSDNSAQTGGGVFMEAHLQGMRSHLTLADSQFSGNSALAQPHSQLFAAGSGGGLLIGDPATVNRTIVAHNTASATGGGIRVDSIASTGIALNDVFIVQNQAATAGGGLFNARGIVTATKTTITDNSPDNCKAATGASCP